MLEAGPLVGMIQIPGIKFGVKDVVTLATLNSAIESEIRYLHANGIESLYDQTTFLAQCLDAWLSATGRKEEIDGTGKISSSNVVYQGRVLVSFMTLIPLCIYHLKQNELRLISRKARLELTDFLGKILKRAGLSDRDGKFISKPDFKTGGYLGSGGVARFRDCLWASSLSRKSVKSFDSEKMAETASNHRSTVYSSIADDS